MIPKQKHGSAKGGTKAKTDKSKSWDSSRRIKTGSQPQSSMATGMAGTPVTAPGGRKSRAKGYA